MIVPRVPAWNKYPVQPRTTSIQGCLLGKALLIGIALCKIFRSRCPYPIIGLVLITDLAHFYLHYLRIYFKMNARLWVLKGNVLKTIGPKEYLLPKMLVELCY